MFRGTEVMFTEVVLLYLAVGGITSAVTLRVFPPVEGFEPDLSTRLLAFVGFACSWPVLFFLALWYGWLKLAGTMGTASLDRKSRRGFDEKLAKYAK